MTKRRIRSFLVVLQHAFVPRKKKKKKKKKKDRNLVSDNFFKIIISFNSISYIKLYNLKEKKKKKKKNKQQKKKKTYQQVVNKFWLVERTQLEMLDS